MSQRANEELRPLFIRFYFDEDVSVAIVNNLRNRGFDVVCARDVAMLGRDDDIQLESGEFLPYHILWNLLDCPQNVGS